MESTKKKFCRNYVLHIIILLAIILSVLNLGDRYFWGDETQLLPFGESITKYGLPVFTEEIRHGNTFFEIDDVTNKTVLELSFFVKPEQLSTNLLNKEIYILHPWLLMYIAAIPISIFGPYNEFFIRIFFVLIGLIAVPLTYALAMHLTKKKGIANLSAFLLSCSVVYLLAIRNMAYYALIIALVPAAILFYLKMTSDEGDRKKAAKLKKHYWWKFALASAFIFHSNWLVFFATMLGIGAHFVIFHISIKTRKSFVRSLIDAKYFFYSVILTLLLTASWFIWTRQYSKSGIHVGIKDFVLLLFASAYQFIVWFVPLLFIMILIVALFNKKIRKDLLRKEYILLVMIVVSYFLFMSFNKYSGAPIRYYYGLLPVAMIINALAISFIWKKTKIAAVVVIILFVFTNIIQIAPILPLSGLITSTLNKNSVLDTGADRQVEYFKQTTTPKMLIIDYIYEITHHVQSSSGFMIDYMREKNVTEGDLLFLGCSEGGTVFYYTNTETYSYMNNFKTRNYDFIVLDASDIRNAEINMSEYEKAYSPLKITALGISADPTHHLYKTAYGEGFYIYHRIKD